MTDPAVRVDVGPAAAPATAEAKKVHKKAKAKRPLAPIDVVQPNWIRLQQQLRHGAAAADGGAPAAVAPPPPPSLPPPAAPLPNGLVPNVPISDKLGLDCEMVGVGADGERSVLARVVIVNWDGRTVYDALVKPRERVTDYRSWVTGLTAKEVARGRDFFEVQREVAELIRNRMLIGHALHNDLAALLLSHPKALIRDTSQYVPLRTAEAKRTGKSHPRALRKLALEELGLEIQAGAHDPAEDAVASLLLYRRHASVWEKALRSGGARGRAAIIKGAKVKRKKLSPEERARQDGKRQREMLARARASAAAKAVDPAVVGVAGAAAAARHIRVEAALPAPRPFGRGAMARPAFLH